MIKKNNRVYIGRFNKQDNNNTNEIVINGIADKKLRELGREYKKKNKRK